MSIDHINTLEEAIRRVHQLDLEMWPERTKPSKSNAAYLGAKLLEEAGELQKEVSKFHRRKYGLKKSSTKEKIQEEVGDVLALALVYSRVYNIDVLETLKKLILKLEFRKLRYEQEKKKKGKKKK